MVEYSCGAELTTLLLGQSFRQSKAARDTQTLLGIPNDNNHFNLGQEQHVHQGLLSGSASREKAGRLMWLRRNKARLHGRVQALAGRLREATTVEILEKRGNDDVLEE